MCLEVGGDVVDCHRWAVLSCATCDRAKRTHYLARIKTEGVEQEVIEGLPGERRGQRSRRKVGKVVGDDFRAPKRSIGACAGDLEQDIARSAGDKDARVEQRAEHEVSLRASCGQSSEPPGPPRGPGRTGPCAPHRRSSPRTRARPGSAVACGTRGGRPVGPCDGGLACRRGSPPIRAVARASSGRYAADRPPPAWTTACDEGRP